MLFAPKEKGQGLVEYASDSCFGRHCRDRNSCTAWPSNRQCIQHHYDFYLRSDFHIVYKPPGFVKLAPLPHREVLFG